MPRNLWEKTPLNDRLRQWRADNQFSDLHAITLIRRRWLAMTVVRLLALEAGAEATPDEFLILDSLLP